MGRDKGQAKGGKGGAIAPAAASKGSSGTPAQLAVRPEECPICGHDVAVSEEQHILGTCGACAGHPYHIDCVQEAWERVQQKIKVRPCDMFATNGTSQRLPVNCPACKSGVMLAADMVKPLCNSVLEDERCYVYNCPFCHSVEEQQEREAEYLQEQKEAARKRREAELEQHRQEQEQREREQRQAAAAAEEAVQMEATAAAVQASLAAAADRQAAMRQELLDREEAELQLSADALALMKRHKRSACITSLTEMGYSASDAAAAAEVAGCEPAAAASLLLDGGLSGKRPSAVSVIREARELLGEGAKLGLSPTAVEAAERPPASDAEVDYLLSFMM
ncbi:hypothetical protein C2E21_5819 [Chlorella sorokiniana]|uniref:UBA domain-containing protein n=1 Tax=Chlorella sorokiniana TaxID=3076 RepID=A0A2P6TM15_CHLSO|nr:hypothetical protein C2E21_5819 [Chlorella sorokiniana]|eukprot:PRW45369.1 hypothetical protein C2E21_5819 [Chlorella sorokiniana]